MPKITKATIQEIGKERFVDGFHDKYGNPADGLAAIFPIVDSGEDNPYKPIGTGFFISSYGLFATAKHVLLDNNNCPKSNLAGIQIIRDQNQIIIREITNVVFHQKADVAIGFLVDELFSKTGSPTINKCFVLTNRDPEIGEIVGTFAYPKPDYKSESDRFIASYTCQGNEGVIEDYFPHGRDKTFLQSKCYQTNMISYGGVSGGPVANKKGEIFGINSTGFDGTPISYVSSIQDIFDLSIENPELPNDHKHKPMTIRYLARIGLVNIAEDKK